MTTNPLNPTATGQDFAATDCDEYSLTMPRTQWLSGAHEDWVTFSLFARKLPENYGFLLAAGLADCLDFLENFRFDAEELDVLGAQTAVDDDPESGLLYEPEFIEYLRALRFTGEVHAIPEGTVVGPGVPLLRISAPRIQATIIESALLATLNQATSAATKAARVVIAADARPVWDGSLRRNPGGATAGVPVARAAYFAGFAGTATVRARVKLAIPTTGTMAHAEVQRWGEDGEQDCFENWLAHNPHRATLLVDTYDIHRGVERAIAASLATGIAIKAIRIDSGDLGQMAAWARARLDGAGMQTVRIMLSGDLDEHKIAALLRQGAPADLFLVGTALPNAGALSVVYKIGEQTALGGETMVGSTLQYVMKRAAGKQTDPGRHQVWRDADGRQIIALANELVPGARQLMTRVMVLGKITHRQPELSELRARAAVELAALPAPMRRLRRPSVIPVARTRALWQLRASLGDREAISQLAHSTPDFLTKTPEPMIATAQPVRVLQHAA